MHEDSALPVVEVCGLLLVACHHLNGRGVLDNFGFLRLHVLVLEVRAHFLKLNDCSASAAWVVNGCRRPRLDHERTLAREHLGSRGVLAD